VSTEPVRGRLIHARHSDPQPVPSAPTSEAFGSSEALGGEPLEFVRFCYRRRRVSWPALYDEMCSVAARGDYRGLGYAELLEQGISFCLPDLPRLAAMTEIVMAEERARHDAVRGEPIPSSLSAAPAPG
jgi:hypothetical protein